MNFPRFKVLDDDSSKKPPNTHLIIETNSSGVLYLVDSVDQTKLYKTTDKCKNWSLIETRTRDIQACFHDRVAGRIYFVSCDQNDTQLTAWYLLLSDDSITEMGTYVDTSTYAFDVWKFGSDFFVTAIADVGGTQKIHILKWVDPNWVVRDNDEAFLDIGFMSEVVYPGGTFPTFIVEDSVDHIEVWAFDDTIPDFYHLVDVGANLTLPVWNLRAITVASASDPIFNFILVDTNDSKNYLYSFDSTISKGAEYNVALMLDRNNIGIVPNEFEKGFGISDQTVYEIKARRGGIRVLQDLSAQLGAKQIKWITDNFLYAE